MRRLIVILLVPGVLVAFLISGDAAAELAKFALAIHDLSQVLAKCLTRFLMFEAVSDGGFEVA